jgi:hypothetical protein
MNRLVDALLANSEVVDLAARRRTAPFDLLADALGDSLLSAQEREQINRDRYLYRRLSACYLPSITARGWDDALRLAEGEEIAAGWWTVMIGTSSGGVGLTAPQDSSLTELIELFTDTTPYSGVLVYYPAEGRIVDLPPDVHCGPAPDGLCRGTCGQCRSKTVWDRTGRGIRCSCPHRQAR